jgi:hypothetical protein
LKGSWTRQEDEIIIAFVRQYGCASWTKLAQMLPGRIGKQCRERWLNHLNPDLSREQWTPAEDLLLMELHERFGNHWTMISSHMPTRADNMIKNRWYSILSKKSKQEVAAAADNYGRPDPLPTVRFMQDQTGDSMPKPATMDRSLLWNSPTTGGSTPISIGLISPMLPSASPLGLSSPYQKLASMLSPWSSEGSKTMFSPVEQDRSPLSLSENRAKLMSLIIHQ